MSKTREKKKGRYFEKIQENGEPALDKILKAARKTFAAHPFGLATIRMIAEEAGVDNSLVHYYFGLKENLFEAVCEGIFEEFNKANESWLDGLNEKTIEGRLSQYLDRLLAYSTENPEPFQIIAINMVQAGTMDIPGYEYITKNIEFTQNLIEKRNPRWKNHPLSRTLINSFTMQVILFIGAKETIGKVHSIDPGQKEYTEFLKNMFLSLFQPLLEQLRKAED